MVKSIELKGKHIIAKS